MTSSWGHVTTPRRKGVEERLRAGQVVPNLY